jgi:hypothetical protein
MNIYINSLIVANASKIRHSLKSLYRTRPDLFGDSEIASTFDLSQPFFVTKDIHTENSGLGAHFNFKNNNRTHHAYVFSDSTHKLKIVRISSLVVINIFE